MISLADNLSIRGKKPNVERDLFDTLENMKNYSPNYLPDIFLAACKETGKFYVYKASNTVDATLGKWRELIEFPSAGDAVIDDIMEEIKDLW